MGDWKIDALRQASSMGAGGSFLQPEQTLLQPEQTLLQPEQTLLQPEQSWGAALGESIKGVLAGLVMVPVACVVLFILEGTTIVQGGALDEGERVVVEASADAIDPALEGRLLYLSGAVLPAEIRDDALGVRQTGLALARKVEMLQWREEQRDVTVDGAKRVEVSYSKVWSERPIESRNFAAAGRSTHGNPPMALRSAPFMAKDAKLGAFALTAPLLQALPQGETMAASEEMAASVGKVIGRPSVARPEGILVGLDPDVPAIGDLRISYALAAPSVATAVARQAAGALTSYQAQNGGEVAILRAGSLPKAAMFGAARAENRLTGWLYRLGGAMVIFLGFHLILRPIAMLLEPVPVIGWLVAGGVSIAAFLLTALVVPVVIGLAWLSYAPGTAIMVIGLAVAAVLGLRALINWMRARSARPPSPVPEGR